MRVVKGAASVALVIAWLVFIFAGFRSNAILLHTPVAPASYCQSRPSEFQMVQMKGPACVESTAARRWNDNQRLLGAAAGVGGLLFLGLFAEQWRRGGGKIKS
jgi:hypothetical protein